MQVDCDRDNPVVYGRSSNPGLCLHWVDGEEWERKYRNIAWNLDGRAIRITKKKQDTYMCFCSYLSLVGFWSQTVDIKMVLKLRLIHVSLKLRYKSSVQITIVSRKP